MGLMMKSNRLLIIEDDKDISEMLSSYLTMEGFLCEVAFDGQEGISAFKKGDFDLVILDLMMPIINGMDVLHFIRERSQIPVLILSAKAKDIDKAIGLGNGADDYIAKPFSMIEVVARVKAAIRRSNIGQQLTNNNSDLEDIIKIHDLSINGNSYSVTKKDIPIKLTQKEFQILKLLATYPKQVFTKAQLFESIWEDDYLGDENVLNVHIRRLREKIEDDPSNPKYVLTLWGIGYKLGDKL